MLQINIPIRMKRSGVNILCLCQVFGGITKIIGNKVEFEDGKESSFDAIVFATGYKTTVNLWLKVRIQIKGLFQFSLLLFIIS